MSLKLFENESIKDGKLTINESFNVTKYETKQSQIVTEATGEKKNKLVLQPTIEAIHAGRTRNGNIYTPEKLRGDFEKRSGAYSFTSPYPKPMLKNHNHECEPTGRITQAEFSNNSAAGKPCIVIKPEVTDPDAIEKVLDGRYMTVSIGATTNEAICNICGTDILKDGFCGHFRNEEYDGVTCGWICGDLYFDECSWVNVPSCSTAGVTKVGEVNTKESTDASMNVDESGNVSINASGIKVIDNNGNTTTVTESGITVENNTQNEDQGNTEGEENATQEGANTEPESGDEGQVPNVANENTDEGSSADNTNEEGANENGEGTQEATNDNTDSNGTKENTEQQENGEDNEEGTAHTEENATDGEQPVTEGAVGASIVEPVAKGEGVSEKLALAEQRAITAENLVEEKNVEISNLNVEINEIREDYETAQNQLAEVQEKNINILASTIVEFKETLNVISTSEKEEELTKLKTNTEETLVSEFHDLLNQFKEESKKRLYSGANTGSEYNLNTESNKPLTEEEKRQMQVEALKALFSGKVKR